jgi:phage tail protein X
MTNYLEHTTSDFERWDTLAYRYYGDATMMQPLIEANPTVPLDPVLPVGLLLLVPIIIAAEPINQELPPWL